MPTFLTKNDKTKADNSAIIVQSDNASNGKRLSTPEETGCIKVVFHPPNLMCNIDSVCRLFMGINSVYQLFERARSLHDIDKIVAINLPSQTGKHHPETFRHDIQSRVSPSQLERLLLLSTFQTVHHDKNQPEREPAALSH